MRRTTLVLQIFLLVFLLGFGCLAETDFPSSKSEVLTNTQSVDLDGDGIQDYIIYDFAPVSAGGDGINVQRHISVSVLTNATYTSLNQDLTDVDLLVADQSLSEFSISRMQDETVCSGMIGISGMYCDDVIGCSRKCSAASVRCRKSTEIYEEQLGSSMIDYGNDNNLIVSHIRNARRMVMELRNANDEDRNAYLFKTREMVWTVADINANPIYSYPAFTFCDHSDFGIPFVLEAAGKIGNYTTSPASYHYTVLLSVKPSDGSGAGRLDAEISGVGLADSLPKSVVEKPEEISSRQKLTTGINGSYAVVSWDSTKASDQGYAVMYAFTSSEPPEALLQGLNPPDLKVRKVNLALLAPTNFFILSINDIVKNYYLAYGAGIGITLAIIFFIYNLAVLIYHAVNERMAGASLTVAFRKAFGRTVVSWKTDLLISIAALALGFHVATTMAEQPAAIPSLVESINVIIKSEMGMVGIALTIIGVMLAYFTIENIAKIIILERVYGMVIRKEKDQFLSMATELKDKIKELETLIDEYTRDDFDVSKEYDILNSLKAEKTDWVSKEVTVRNKATIEEHLSRADSAVSSLRERKKIADENWPKWKESISKMLVEQDEVYTSSLITVPASLRAWALGRYVKESGVEGISFERDSLRKKKVSPQQLVREMIDKELLKGAVVLKQDKIAVAEFAEGSGTVMSALTLKLNSHLQSMAKNLGQHPPQSFVSIGDKSVIVLMKNRTVDSVLFLNKDKFKDAVEQWKAKMKIFDSSG
ncbi:hypothetical protein H0O00_00030 [Candidatus Micrarchaeota archaeon]|nr:hypothetical protein [Candidatus Micrarchaeota archaeon]